MIEDKSFFNALLDTGHLSLMREDFRTLVLQDYRNRKYFWLKVKFGYFQMTITVNDLLFPLTFHVVLYKALTINVILWTDFISQPEIKIDQNEINK